MKHSRSLVLLTVLCGCSAAPAALEQPMLSGFALHFGPLVVAPGEEGVVCLDAPGPVDDVWVSGWNAHSALVHHVNIYQRTSGEPFSVPTACGGGAGFGTGFFSLANRDATVDFRATPGLADAALRLPAGSDLLWDVHYLNTTDTPAEATVDVAFTTVPPPSREIRRFTFNGTTGIDIAPGAEKTLSYSCAGPVAPVQILTATAHVHAHDTIAMLSFGGTERYRSTNWEDPVEAHFDSLMVPAGAGASWACTIRNTSSATLRYANEVQTGEMCILHGFLLGEKWACTVE